jgi:hypothetical protein
MPLASLELSQVLCENPFTASDDVPEPDAA